MILEATARVLVEEGEECTTTNRVAKRAGVSIGSLYQYFPNKQALVRALFERHLAQAEAMRPPALRPGSDVPLEERVRLAIRWLLDVHAADPALHQVLTGIAPRVLGSEALRAFERAYHHVLRGVLEPYADELRPKNLELAAFVVAQCMESLIHGAVVHHPTLLDRDELAREMTTLLVGYLRPAVVT
ncbi:MAG: TetR/AcrR family transcriptional regulator [Proteobacteria bacterium]|nr:TetR/AcrR family transcriptional regulator [Pseudomonadota bacterium]